MYHSYHNHVLILSLLLTPWNGQGMINSYQSAGKEQTQVLKKIKKKNKKNNLTQQSPEQLKKTNDMPQQQTAIRKNSQKSEPMETCNNELMSRRSSSYVNELKPCFAYQATNKTEEFPNLPDEIIFCHSIHEDDGSDTINKTSLETTYYNPIADTDPKPKELSINITQSNIQNLPYTTYFADTTRGIGPNVLRELISGKFINNQIANGERTSQAIHYFILYKQPNELVSLVQNLTKINFPIGNAIRLQARGFLNTYALETTDEFRIEIQKKIAEHKTLLLNQYEMTKQLISTQFCILKILLEKSSNTINQTIKTTVNKANSLYEGVTALSTQPALKLSDITLLGLTNQDELVNTTLTSVDQMKHNLNIIEERFDKLIESTNFKS